MTLENTILQCKSGSTIAQRELFDMTCDHLKSVARRYVLDDSGAEDVLQETYIRIYHNLHKFNYINDAATIGWMRQITATEAIRIIKRNKRWASASEFVSTSHVLEKELVLDDDLFYMLTRLPARQRIVFNMFAMEGYSHKEIAVHLDIAESSSRSLLTRARAYLQSQVVKIKRYEKA